MHILNIILKDGWMPGNLSAGWRLLGCSVEEFFYGTHMGKSWDREGLRKNHQLNVELLATARRLKREGRLDLIFALIYDDVLEADTARGLRSLDVPMVNYHVDLVGQWYRVLRTGRYFDRIACAHRDHWSGLRRAGVRPYYMPMAANPPGFEPARTPANHAYQGIRYLGSPWTYRCRVLAELARKRFPVEIYGNSWRRATSHPSEQNPWRKNLHDLLHYAGPRLREEGWKWVWDTPKRRWHESRSGGERDADIPAEIVRGSYREEDFLPLVRGAAINLGFTQFLGEPGEAGERRQVRLREFEIPMAGGFYLTQQCDQLREFYQAGKHVVLWNDLSDLQEIGRYYLDHAEERQRIAQAGQEHCLRNHTWAQRFRGLLKELNLSCPAA